MGNLGRVCETVNSDLLLGYRLSNDEQNIRDWIRYVVEPASQPAGRLSQCDCTHHHWGGFQFFLESMTER